MKVCSQRNCSVHVNPEDTQLIQRCILVEKKSRRLQRNIDVVSTLYQRITQIVVEIFQRVHAVIYILVEKTSRRSQRNIKIKER